MTAARNRRQALAVLAGAVFASAGAHALTPRRRLADELGPVRLDDRLPRSFADWLEHPMAPAGIVNPQQAALLDQLYSEIVMREYRNARTGYGVMLSVAYGSDQRDGLQLHYPEVCYPSQGFRLIKTERSSFESPYGIIPVTHLDTKLGAARPEVVTYWSAVGGTIVTRSWLKKVAEMQYSLLKGVVPDGLIFRVSSISEDYAGAISQHVGFCREMLGHVDAATRMRLGVA